MRALLTDFAFANAFYAGNQVTAWRVDPVTFVKTINKATLYADLSTNRVLLNPQTLDGEGKFGVPVYFDEAVVLEITGANVPNHETGVILPQSRNRGTWATATQYWPGDLVTDGAAGANTGNLYWCELAHTSGTWATDLTAVKWTVVLSISAIVAAVIAGGVGIGEAPNNATPYSRQSLGWTSAPTLARVVAVETAVAAISGGVAFIGTYNSTTNIADFTVASGYTDGVLVAASAATNKYVIVTTAGTGTAPAPIVALAIGDWLISNGSVWTKVALSGGTLTDLQVAITAGLTGISSTDVHGAIGELIADITAEATTRATADTTEATTRAAADTTEITARTNADNSLTASVTAAIVTANAYTDAQLTAAAAPSDGVLYGRRSGTWVAAVQDARRQTAATTDTPASGDVGGVVGYLSGTAVTIIANDLGASKSVSLMQMGTGQLTVAAGAGITLVSDKSTPSFQTARRGAVITIVSKGDNTVFVVGNTA